MVREVSGSLKEEQCGVLCFRKTFKKVDVDGSGEINMQVNLKHLKVAIQFIPRNNKTETVEMLLTVSASTHSSNIWAMHDATKTQNNSCNKSATYWDIPMSCFILSHL